MVDDRLVVFCLSFISAYYSDSNMNRVQVFSYHLHCGASAHFCEPHLEFCQFFFAGAELVDPRQNVLRLFQVAMWLVRKRVVKLFFEDLARFNKLSAAFIKSSSGPRSV